MPSYINRELGGLSPMLMITSNEVTFDNEIKFNDEIPLIEDTYLTVARDLLDVKFHSAYRDESDNKHYITCDSMYMIMSDSMDSITFRHKESPDKYFRDLLPFANLDLDKLSNELNLRYASPKSSYHYKSLNNQFGLLTVDGLEGFLYVTSGRVPYHFDKSRFKSGEFKALIDDLRNKYIDHFSMGEEDHLSYYAYSSLTDLRFRIGKDYKISESHLYPINYNRREIGLGDFGYAFDTTLLHYSMYL